MSAAQSHSAVSQCLCHLVLEKWTAHPPSRSEAYSREYVLHRFPKETCQKLAILNTEWGLGSPNPGFNYVCSRPTCGLPMKNNSPGPSEGNCILTDIINTRVSRKDHPGLGWALNTMTEKENTDTQGGEGRGQERLVQQLELCYHNSRSHLSRKKEGTLLDSLQKKRGPTHAFTSDF